MLHVSVQENMKHERHYKAKEDISMKHNLQAKKADAPAATILLGKVSSLLTAYAITYA